ncbi:uncharacterized protein N7458_003951 [Penicillium daleae]|uniref:Uncharacterized protein n=1 Tax=Penicillium daleae TaxID=63821 RepID=A0AAD6CBM2_9EURO|nr:uncharacterized protein N7458_003951 [Penicillium daleae]KAJ5455687.1 hypothetical protein N7458_003951 [Penicillium daleae]
MTESIEFIDIMDSDDSLPIHEESDAASSQPPLGSPMGRGSPTLDCTANTGRTVSQQSPILMIPSSKRGPKIRSGVWLSAGIPREYLVNGIPIAGVINERGVPRPSLRGPDIWPTEDTIEEVGRMAEHNDWSAIQESKSVFHLAGPHKNQLRDAYIWIALRQKKNGSSVMSESARNRLVPKWRELVDSKNNAPPPATFDLRWSGAGTESSNSSQIDLQGIFERLDVQNTVVEKLEEQIERQGAAIQRLADSIDAEAVINQQVVAGLRQVERALEGPLGGCRQQ